MKIISQIYLWKYYNNNLFSLQTWRNYTSIHFNKDNDIENEEVINNYLNSVLEKTFNEMIRYLSISVRDPDQDPDPV